MGISKIPSSSTYRHIDIIDSNTESYPFGVLYFTGSGGFNAKMRSIALEKGYSLNEYRFTHKNTKLPVTSDEIQQRIGKPLFDTERDIFKFLNMDYVIPSDRIQQTLSKI